MQYCIYLRKSRADDEAEQRGDGETLARHEKTLTQLAKMKKLNVTHIYREIVSGETIAARPMVQKLLSEVEKCTWAGVLVMEVERLARGDTVDQGIIAQTFKFSSTKIITPMKTYNPNNEFDEEYFEFGLFMSRREYKTINRRLQRGRVTSVQEGKYVASKPPYGYLKKRIEHDKGFTLSPHPDQADVVKVIFEWYTKGELQKNGTYKRLGISLIAQRLNDLGIKPQKADIWAPSSIRDILINPIYIGMIRWNWRPSVKRMTDGNIIKARPRSNNPILVDGLHDGIVEEEVFNKAQTYLKSKNLTPIGDRRTIKNPLAGLIVCGKCGKKMIRRPKGSRASVDIIMCPTPACGNVSVSLPLLEAKIIKYLGIWFADYTLKWENKCFRHNPTFSTNLIEHSLQKNKEDIRLFSAQLNNTYNLLERGVYSSEVFKERYQFLEEQIKCLKSKNEALSKSIQGSIQDEEHTNHFIPPVEDLISVYHRLETAEAKNHLLKEVLSSIVYLKSKTSQGNHSPDHFSIELFPLLPKRSH